jgi:hypothetical protein
MPAHCSLRLAHTPAAQDLARPEQEVVDATLAATKAVIEARVNGTLSANQPKSLPAQPGAPQYIKYTPAKQGPEYNSGASHRIIKMHTVAVDPLQPPKFAHKKARALTLVALLSSARSRSRSRPARSRAPRVPRRLTRLRAGASRAGVAAGAGDAQPAAACERQGQRGLEDPRVYQQLEEQQGLHHPA